MIFVCDVGNTNIVLGVYKSERLQHHWRLETNANKTEDEYAMIIKNLFNDVGLRFSDIEGVSISSVVPSIMFSLERLCEKYFHKRPLVVTPQINTGLKLKYNNPQEIGADRIVNAVAATALYKAPLIVVDFGTATTFCYIDENEYYKGGAIAPGVNISTEALYKQASKLPRIELTAPEHVVGTSTVGAMQSGIVYGYVGLVEGIVNRMKAVATQQPTVIATGGLASFIAKETDIFDHLDPFLTLKGLYLIYQKNVSEGESSE
ncbi:type III pantothenate kinase [Pullulanibacillus camelliae]|uniref:Type III pantothenate kinase n=1 Tax=Pullulanibacillus camelliae TaxID=1707096 RepID=A0A8J2YMZ8_9BACL|nr:type III pantothenate kinase [Pullulanibacillus camelliae]GGE54149.1 type III pantothenate kinase [Pullulanibacillus camelliae]